MTATNPIAAVGGQTGAFLKRPRSRATFLKPTLDARQHLPKRGGASWEALATMVVLVVSGPPRSASGLDVP